MYKEYDNVTERKFEEAKQRILMEGGDVYSDSFSVKGVEGNFELYNDGTLEIEVTDKPWLASWGVIENGLDNFFG